jgi:hypothetical protein
MINSEWTYCLNYLYIFHVQIMNASCPYDSSLGGSYHPCIKIHAFLFLLWTASLHYKFLARFLVLHYKFLARFLVIAQFFLVLVDSLTHGFEDCLTYSWVWGRGTVMVGWSCRHQFMDCIHYVSSYWWSMLYDCISDERWTDVTIFPFVIFWHVVLDVFFFQL